MTDTHGNTPGGPVPPTSGDEHAQHAAQTGQQPYYQQSYQQPYQAQHTPGQVTVEKKSHGLRTFLLAFAGAALACVIGLGGFGIWYGTFAAVRARTREVGLKKAMGGSDKDILAQFLAEALCKSVAGGLLGILVGTLSVEIGAWSLGTSISYPLLAASSAGSILFSAIIGVAGGLYPAIQASRMDVVSALRFE